MLNVGNAKFTESVAILAQMAPIAIDGSTGITTPTIQIANIAGGATIPKDIERLVFILQMGVLADVVDMKLQLSASTNNTLGTPTDITDAAITQVAETADGTIKVIEISAAAIAKALAAVPTKVFIGALITVGSTGAGGVVSCLVLGIGKELSAKDLMTSASLLTEVIAL